MHCFVICIPEIFHILHSEISLILFRIFKLIFCTPTLNVYEIIVTSCLLIPMCFIYAFGWSGQFPAAITCACS